MSTITRERVAQFINNPLNNGLTRGEQMELARIALASLEAEPVGYFYADKPGDWYQLSDGDRVPGHRRIPLYANPQSSPVVKLPNEFISSEGIVVQIEKLMAVLAVHGIQYERKGNAFRAAMLQGADGNSPVIPDGYALVPVDLTLEMRRAWDSAPNANTDDDDWNMQVAYAAMLAAAPQQEVKS